MRFKEPLNYNSGIIPEGYSEPEYFHRECTKIHDQLVESDMKSAVKLVDPSGGSTNTEEWIGWNIRNMDIVINKERRKT